MSSDPQAATPAESDDAVVEPITVPSAPEDAGADGLLTAALAAAQAEFPPITKSKTAVVRGKDGKPGYEYTYADIGDVLAAVRPVLARHGLALVQRTVREANGNVLLVTDLRHVAGAVITSDVDLGQRSGNPQAFGGALTYLRRYELVTLLGIAAEEDTDAQHVEPAGADGQPRQAPPAPLPGWAQPIGEAAKGPLLDELERMFVATAPLTPGVDTPPRDLAKGYLVAWRDALGGGIPIGLEGIVRALTIHIAGPPKPEPDPAATRAAQDAAAEAPDPPAPEDAPVEDAPPASEAAQLQPPLNPLSSAGARYDAWPTSTKFLEDAAKAHVFGHGEPSDAAQAKLLRDFGCTCPNPLPGDGERDTACPFADHGIQF